MTKLWFKAKRYGWGWTPCSWQGWVITLFFIVLVIVPAFYFEKLKISLIYFYAYLLILILLLIYVCYKTGEKPRWHWG